MKNNSSKKVRNKDREVHPEINLLKVGFNILENMKIYPFNNLSSCDLIIDAIYEGGN